MVQSLAAVGKGVPDLLVCCSGKLALVEVKDGDKCPSAQKLTPDQIQFHSQWPVQIITNETEAIELWKKSKMNTENT